MSRINIIAAMTSDGVIGKGGKLPWRIPEELAHFKQATMGKPLIMGRKTFDSLGGRTLPGRRIITLTQTSPAYAKAPAGRPLTPLPIGEGNLNRAATVDEAIQLCGDAPEIMIAGGAQIYELFLPIANHMTLSIIHGQFEGDTYFPKVDWSLWRLVDETPYADFTVRQYERV